MLLAIDKTGQYIFTVMPIQLHNMTPAGGDRITNKSAVVSDDPPP